MVFGCCEHVHGVWSGKAEHSHTHTLAQAWRSRNTFERLSTSISRTPSDSRTANHIQNGKNQPARTQQLSAQCADRISRVVLFATRERAVALSSLYVVHPASRVRKHSRNFQPYTDTICSQANTSTHFHSHACINPERSH